MSTEQALKDIEAMQRKFEAEYGLFMELPPRSFKELRGEFVEIDGGRRMKVRFPYDERFANPLGMFQGGMLCALLDNAFGPLSYLAFKGPSVTLELSTRFIRPFMAKDEYVEVEAHVVSISSTTLVMQAEVRNSRNKLIATASTTFLVVQEDMLTRMSPGSKPE